VSKCGAAALDRLTDGIPQHVIAERLGQELHCTSHHVHGYGVNVVAGQRIARSPVGSPSDGTGFAGIEAATHGGRAGSGMAAHPLALQSNLQALVEVAVDENSAVVFPAPLMSTIGALDRFWRARARPPVSFPTAPWPRTHRRIVPRPAAQSWAGEISDVAAGILYLERATFVTGEALHIDGGEAAGH
jgi:hypothetical protein